MTVNFFAEVSVLSRALHPFIVHHQETASDFKILSNLYRYPSQIILRWPLFVSTSVTSILFEILKLNEKSIHIYLPLGVHVYLPLGVHVYLPLGVHVYLPLGVHVYLPLGVHVYLPLGVHVYLPLGVHIYLPLGVHVAVKSRSFCSVILTQIQIFLF